MLSNRLLIFIKDMNKINILKGYCFKCHTNKEIIDEKWGKTTNRRRLCKGKCIECGGNVARMCGIDTSTVLNNNDDVENDYR